MTLGVGTVFFGEPATETRLFASFDDPEAGLVPIEVPVLEDDESGVFYVDNPFAVDPADRPSFSDFGPPTQMQSIDDDNR